MNSNEKYWSLRPWVWMAISVLLIEAGLAFWAGLPGQMSTDSIVQLYEGRTHQTISFNPALMAVLLGALDSLGSAPVGFVLLSQGLFSWTLWLAFGGSFSRGRWWQFLLALVLVCNPVILAYTGIVWKDILFAHAIVLVFLLIFHWQERNARPSALQIVLVILLMTIVVGVRQQGLLFVVVAAWWLAVVVSKSRVRAWALIVPLVLAPLLINKVVTETAQKPLDDPLAGSVVGFKILMQYDLVGIAVNGGKMPERDPVTPEGKALAELSNQVPLYSAYRVDTLINPSPNFWSLPLLETATLWREGVERNPAAYFKHRWNQAQAFLGLKDVRQCAPVFSGIGGPVQHALVPQELTSLLGLQPGMNHSSQYIIETAWELAKTPLLMQWAYILALLMVAVVLLIQRRYVLLSLVGCCYVYFASYFVLGIACDFRYGYVLTVSASVLAVAALFKRPQAATAAS